MPAVRITLNLLLVAVLAMPQYAGAAPPKRGCLTYSLRSLFIAVGVICGALGYRDMWVTAPIRSANDGEALHRAKSRFRDIGTRGLNDLSRRDVRHLSAYDLYLVLLAIQHQHPEMLEGTSFPLDQAEKFAAYVATDADTARSPWDYSLHPKTTLGHYDAFARSRRAEIESVLYRYYLEILITLEEREPDDQETPIHPSFYAYPLNLERIHQARDGIKKGQYLTLMSRQAGVYLMDRAQENPALQKKLLEELLGSMTVQSGTVIFSRSPSGDVLYTKRIGSPNHRPKSFLLKVVFGPHPEVYENHLEERLEELVEQWLIGTEQGSLWPNKGYARNYKDLVDLYIRHLLEDHP